MSSFFFVFSCFTTTKRSWLSIDKRTAGPAASGATGTASGAEFCRFAQKCGRNVSRTEDFLRGKAARPRISEPGAVETGSCRKSRFVVLSSSSSSNHFLRLPHFPRPVYVLTFLWLPQKCVFFFARIFQSPFFCDMFNFYEIYFWRRKQLILQQILRRPICLTCLTFDMFRYFQFLLNLWLLPSLDQILQSFWFHLFSVSLFSLHF